MSSHTLGDFSGESAELQLPISGGADVTNPGAGQYGQDPHVAAASGCLFADWPSAPYQIPQDPHVAAASGCLFADWPSAPYQAPQGPQIAASGCLFGVDWSSAPFQISQGTPNNEAIPTALVQHPHWDTSRQPIIHAVPQYTTAFSAPAGQVFATMPGSSAPQAAEDDRIRCPKGCLETFGRTGDYRRHMKKHDDPIFKCVAIDCDKKFYRLDKLRSHAKGHGINL